MEAFIDQDLDFEEYDEDSVNQLLGYPTNDRQSDETINHISNDQMNDKTVHISDEIVEQRTDQRNGNSSQEIDVRSNDNKVSNCIKSNENQNFEYKSLEEQNDLPLSHSEDTKVKKNKKKKKKKSSHKHKSDQKKHRNKNTSVDPLNEQNSLDTNGNYHSSNVHNSCDERTTKSQVLENSNETKSEDSDIEVILEILIEHPSQEWDKYDTECVTESCHVLLKRRTKSFIQNAIKGEIEFVFSDESDWSEDNVEDSDVDHNPFHPIVIKSPEITFSDSNSNLESNLNNIQDLKTKNLQNSENQIKSPPKSESKLSNELQLSESSSDDEKDIKDKSLDFQTNAVESNESNEQISTKTFGLIGSGTDSCDNKQNSSNVQSFDIQNNGKKSKSIESTLSMTKKQRLDTNKKSNEVHKKQNQIKPKNIKNDNQLKSLFKEKKKKSKKSTKDESVVSPFDNFEYNSGQQLSNEELQHLVNNSANIDTDMTCFKCNLCTFVAQQEMELILHSAVHFPNAVVYSCHLCEDFFFDYESLERHIQRSHPYPKSVESNALQTYDLRSEEINNAIVGMEAHSFEDQNDMPSSQLVITFKEEDLSQTNNECKQIVPYNGYYNGYTQPIDGTDQLTNENITMYAIEDSSDVNSNQNQNGVNDQNQYSIECKPNDSLTIAVSAILSEHESDEESVVELFF